MPAARARIEKVTPDITRQAQAILKELYPLALGAEKPFESGSKRYIAVLERHYHPPGGTLKPWGPHKGISVFELVDAPEKPAVESKVGTFHLGAMSLARLSGVHPDLVKVVKRAIEITPIDFSVIEGKRTKLRQEQLVKSGASETMNSRHLTGHAVDLAPYEGGQVHWDWPRFRRLAEAVKQAAKEVGVKVEWGGNWTEPTDGPHWQLPWSTYP